MTTTPPPCGDAAAAPDPQAQYSGGTAAPRPVADALFARHLARLENAWLACRTRHCWSAFPEMPGHYPDSEAAQAAATAAFDAMLGRPFALEQPGITGWLGHPELPEASPYTRRPLGIRYPQSDLDTLFPAAETAISAGWRQASPQQRVGVLMEIVEQLYQRLFESVQAVFHTTGQSFNMSYAGSGVNALDRAIEAIAHAWDAMRQVPDTATWERRFGASRVALDKRYRLMPRGVAVCFCCASFPTWNAWPSIMASLATGNAVIVKPHPAAVLPMALTVKLMRAQLAAAGFDPNLVALALDTPAAPLGKALVNHPRTAIVDFTGSARFGQWVERNAHPALCYTETSGCNTVVLESCDDLDVVLRSLATSLCLFSAQMCTSPQNIYVPRHGVRTRAGTVPLTDVTQRLAQAIRALAGDPARAATILAAIQSDQTLDLLADLAAQGAARGKVLLASTPYSHPQFPQARTATPLMLQVTTAQRDLYAQERFGPVSFVIACDDADDALAHATADARAAGGLTAFLYSTAPAFVARAEDAYALAGAQLTINMSGPMPLNFAAAYSDYHVSGLNPAGNASLTDHAFVAARFRIAQAREPQAA